MNYLIILTLLLTPTYTIRFSLFGFPTNLLMVWVLLVWIAFCIYLLIKPHWQEFVGFFGQVNKKILILTGLFFLAGIISLFVKGFELKKLGQFIVLFLQPISLFFISTFIINKNQKTKPLILNTLYLILAACGLYAIIQYFTLLGLPPAWWGNSVEPKRAIAFFSHPNFYALFAAPLLALLIPDLGLRIKDKGLRIFDIKLLAWLLGSFGLFLSMSRAGWLGLATAIAIYLIVAADKKIRKLIFSIAVAGAIVIIAVPNLRWRFVLPFYGEKSSVSRLSLWQTGWKGVKESPIFGLGLTGFANSWPRLNTDPGLTDAHNFPHNIFLDLWIETGFLGLISMLGLMALMLYRGFKDKMDIIKLGVSLFLIALITQGQIDNPYFKNDLVVVFWIILALAV